MDEPTGKTTIAPSVLHTIVRLTTLATPGVCRLSSREALVSVPEDGVKVTLQDGKIEVEVYIRKTRALLLRTCRREFPGQLQKWLAWKLLA